MTSPNPRRPMGRNPIVLGVGTAVIAVLATLAVVALLGRWPITARQADVAARGQQVMPFDLEQTTHQFQQLADGGLQTVVANNPANQQQIALIQAHLQEEAVKFRQGDFADPAAIHGATMPGLAALRDSAGNIDVAYSALPNGAQIRYRTSDAALVMALHQWFSAQLSDHGAHATDH